MEENPALDGSPASRADLEIALLKTAISNRPLFYALHDIFGKHPQPARLLGDARCIYEIFKELEEARDAIYSTKRD